MAVIDKHRGAISELRACSYLLSSGYEVFRNVSAHGSIDVIGIKDGKVYYFDVKSARLAADGSIFPPSLTPEQHRIGVLGLMVLPDGSIAIADRTWGNLKDVECPECKTVFSPRKAHTKFCSPECRSARWNAFKLEKRVASKSKGTA